jgi:phosphoglycerol transferase MdoB-like AlkP superfamily enzyme
MVEQSLMMIRSLMVFGDMGRAFSSIYEKHFRQRQRLFFASVFTVSSHEPYIPKEYKKRFKEGGVPIHKCAEYTDFALKRFFTEAKKTLV